MQLLYNNY